MTDPIRDAFEALWKELPIPGEYDAMDEHDQMMWKSIARITYRSAYAAGAASAGRDAARYQVIRNLPDEMIKMLIGTGYDFVPFIAQHVNGKDGGFAVLTGEDADKAIDAAMPAAPGKQE